MRPAGQSLSPPRARVPPRADADECRRYRLGVASTLFAQAALNAAEAVEQACRRGALLSTGMAPLDEALGGGLQTGEVVELVGAAGSGKSQACMAIGARQLAASDWHVLYIDTALSFTAERMLQLVQLELSEATPAAGADGGAAAAAADPRQLGKRRLRERLRVVSEAQDVLGACSARARVVGRGAGAWSSSEASCRPALRARVARRGALELHRRRVVVCSDTSETLPRPFRGPSEALPALAAVSTRLRTPPLPPPARTAAAVPTPADIDLRTRPRRVRRPRPHRGGAFCAHLRFPPSAGLDLTVVMPSPTPSSRRDAVSRLGASVLLSNGETLVAYFSLSDFFSLSRCSFTARRSSTRWARRQGWPPRRGSLRSAHTTRRRCSPPPARSGSSCCGGTN